MLRNAVNETADTLVNFPFIPGVEARVSLSYSKCLELLAVRKDHARNGAALSTPRPSKLLLESVVVI